ncbi:hypothetical protein CLOP_g2929, partial [Closterium sp. NIES-67]
GAADPNKFDYPISAVKAFPAESSAAVSVSCTIAKSVCATVRCPAHSKCTVTASGGATCTCKRGYTPVGGQCINVCAKVQCPAGAACQARNGRAFCICRSGQPPVNGVCKEATSSTAVLEYVMGHNAARSAIGLAPLAWNLTLAVRAQNWARVLATKHQCMQLEHGDTKGVGQNLFAGCCNGFYKNADAVQAWVDEIKDYKKGKYPDSCRAGKQCGHYTQVVWETTKQLGCGRVDCANGWTVWACDYYPPGNYIGQYPY